MSVNKVTTIEDACLEDLDASYRSLTKRKDELSTELKEHLCAIHDELVSRKYIKE